MEKETIIELKNIRKEFPGVVALDNVNMKIRASERLKPEKRFSSILIFLFWILYRNSTRYFILRYLKKSRLLQLQKKTSGMSG